MERSRKVVYTAALLGIASSGPASRTRAQELPDVRNIRPVVMLLVDTSGSMERKPAPTSGASCGECKPQCTGNAALDINEKNRWAVTLEALTGSFDEFRCYERDRSGTGFTETDFDYGYFLPHYDFYGARPGETPSTQLDDGLLDAFDNVVKFGLMTFDGVGTTLGGDTLVPYSPNWSDPSFLSLANGSQGMYSYGNIRQLSFPGCTDVYGINSGVRGPAPAGGPDVPGALISVGSSDSAADVMAVNTAIQNSLRQVRPFGGTPIAAMLDDLEFYLTTDPAVRSGSDRYYNCRERYAILLTDGAPDALFRDARFQCQTAGNGPAGNQCAGSGCQCPYDTEVQIAQRLVSSRALSSLFLVGYNVDDPSAIATLNDIAAAGNSREALLAATAATLRAQLRDIMELASPDASSRSVPVSVQTATYGGNTYEITSGFRLGATANDPWYGILNRRRITCTGSTPNSDTTLTAEDLFHEHLNGQGTRDVFTAPPATRQEARGTLYADYLPEWVLPGDSALETSTDLRAASFGITRTRNLNRPSTSPLADTPIAPDTSVNDATALGQGLEVSDVVRRAFTDTGSDALSPTLFSASGTADVGAIVDYVLGRTGARANHKLGDIFHSNPVVLNPLTANEVRYMTSDVRYASWLTSLAGLYNVGGVSGARPGVIFVGTNDGILHAFNLETWQASGRTVPAGEELWGFVPPALYNKMETMITPTHQWMFDGTPVVKDVVLHRPDRIATNALYRTVLVSAVRGAPAFVALDVTFPDRPRFMWQRSFPGLGNTTGTPALTQVNIAWDGGAVEQRAVAILPGGSGTLSGSGSCGVQTGDLDALAPNSGARSSVRCWQQRGRSLYVVDVASGRLIQEFDARHFSSPLSGGVSVDGLGTAVTRAAYFSDDDGVLWRLSMVDPDPENWLVAPIYDMFHGAAYNAGRGSAYAPVVTRDPFNNVVLAAGTGDLDNLTDTASHRVVSITERRATTSAHRNEIVDQTINGLAAPETNWEIHLRPGESVTGPLTLFEEVLYFGTFESPTGVSGDACELGTSRLYGANVRIDDDLGNTPIGPKPELFDDKGTLATGDDTTVLSEEVDPTGSSLVLGLAITRQPVCSVGNNAPNATANSTSFVPTGASGGGGFQLKALVGGGNDRAIGAKVGGSQLREYTRNLRVTPQMSAIGFAGAVE